MTARMFISTAALCAAAALIRNVAAAGKGPGSANASKLKRSMHFDGKRINRALGKRLAGTRLLSVRGCTKVGSINCVTIAYGSATKFQTRTLLDLRCSSAISLYGKPLKTSRRVCWKGYLMVEHETTSASGWTRHVLSSRGTSGHGTYLQQRAVVSASMSTAIRGAAHSKPMAKLVTTTRVKYSSGGGLRGTEIEWTMYDVKGKVVRSKSCTNGLCKDQLWQSPLASSVATTKSACRAQYRQRAREFRKTAAPRFALIRAAAMTAVGISGAAVGAAGGCAGGALSGAVAGSSVPVVGTASGGVLGCIGGAVAGGATGAAAGAAVGDFYGDVFETTISASRETWNQAQRDTCMATVSCIRDASCSCERNQDYDYEDCKAGKTSLNSESSGTGTTTNSGSGGNVSGQCTSDDECGAGERCDLHLRMCIKG